VRRDRRGAALLGGALLAAALLIAPRARAAEEVLIAVKDPTVRVQAELDLFVNDAPGGTSFVVLERGDALVIPSDLERAGLVVAGGTRVTVGERQLVSLRSLGPTITYAVDEQNLALRVTAPPELLARHVLDLAPRHRPAGVERRYDPGAFLDYAANTDLRGHVGLSFQGGGRIDRWLALTDVNRSIADGRWTRGMTSATRDDPVRLERLTIGDVVASAGTLGGGALLGGVAFGREWSLDPHVVRAPYPAATAIVTAPSTLEVYVNGALVRQQALGPGYWDLANLPVAAGQSSVRTVIRDAFGRERVIDSRFYFSGGLLAPGYSDYGVAAGFLRQGLGGESFDYGPPAASGRYRFGASDWFTPEVRGEASRDLSSAGGGATLGTPVGELQVVGAGSAAGGHPGTAVLLGWSWTRRVFSSGLRVLYQSDHYANLALAPELDRPVLDVFLNVGVALARSVSLSSDLDAGRDRDLGRYARIALRTTYQLVPGLMLSVSADYGNDAGGPKGVRAFAGISWAYARHMGDVSVSRDRDGTMSKTVSASTPLLRDSAVAYNVRAVDDDHHTSFDGAIQGQTSFGRAELQGVRAGDVTSWNASAAGGIVFVDRGVYFSRPTSGNSFALVDAGIPHVGVTVENEVVGRTGADGKLLVTDLQPYYGNRLGIVERDVPLEYEPGRTAGWFAPPYRGVAVARFDLRRISAITGQLTVDVRGQPQPPANGELSVIVDGELRESPITDAGHFFLERMPPGKHVVQAVWGGGSCRAAITLPMDAPPVFDAGEVRCILDTLDPSGKVPSLRDPNYADFAPPAPADRAGLGAGSGGGGR
jgi:outer membrane usher protein